MAQACAAFGRFNVPFATRGSGGTFTKTAPNLHHQKGGKKEKKKFLRIAQNLGKKTPFQSLLYSLSLSNISQEQKPRTPPPPSPLCQNCAQARIRKKQNALLSLLQNPFCVVSYSHGASASIIRKPPPRLSML